MATSLQNDTVVDFVFCFSGWRVKVKFPNGTTSFIGPERGYRDPEKARQVATEYAIENNFATDFTAGQTTAELVKIKTRNYDLKTGPEKPVYSDRRHSGGGQLRKGVDSSVDGREDYLPHTNKVGDEVELQVEGLRWVGEVKAVRGPVCLLYSLFLDNWVLHDFDKRTTRVLGDEDRCLHCGEFFCTCHQHDGIDSTVTTTNEMKPVSIAELIQYSDKQSIECLEGRIASVFKQNSGIKNGHKWTIQDAVLKEGNNEVKIAFANRDESFVEGLKGKMVRLTPAIGTNGSKGLYWAIEQSKGKTYPKVKCSDEATVEILGSGGEPTPRNSGSSSSTAQPTSNGGGNGGGGGYQSNGGADPADEFYGITVEKRVEEHLRILGVVNVTYEAMKQDAEGPTLPELTPEIMDRIATGISMSFRGRFGAYRPVLFEGETPPAPTGKPPHSGEAVPKWGDYVHPKKGKKLSELDEDELRDQVAWALTTQVKEDAKDARALQVNLIAAAHEKGLSLKKVALDYLLKGEEDGNYEQNDVTAYLKENFSVDKFADLGEENYTLIIKQRKDVIKAISDIAEARKGASGGDEIPD
jgi:hypothetical protein